MPVAAVGESCECGEEGRDAVCLVESNSNIQQTRSPRHVACLSLNRLKQNADSSQVLASRLFKTDGTQLESMPLKQL